MGQTRPLCCSGGGLFGERIQRTFVCFRLVLYWCVRGCESALLCANNVALTSRSVLVQDLTTLWSVGGALAFILLLLLTFSGGSWLLLQWVWEAKIFSLSFVFDRLVSQASRLLSNLPPIFLLHNLKSLCPSPLSCFPPCSLPGFPHVLLLTCVHSDPR